MKRLASAAAAALALTLSLAACTAGPAAPAPAPTTAPGATTAAPPKAAEVTWVAPSAVFLPKEEVAAYAVAVEMGYYKEENLTVKAINADGSVAAVQAVGAGSGSVTPSDLGAGLSGVAKGAPVKVIGGLVTSWPWSIAVPEGSPITDAKGLAGKKIGVISLASGSAPFARAFLQAGGVDPNQVQLLPVGLGSQAATALTSGAVDALALFNQAYSTLESSGIKLSYLKNPADFDGIRSLSFTANAGQLDADPSVFERFLRATYKGMTFSAKHPDKALEMGYKVFPQILGGKDKASRFDADLASLKAWLADATPPESELLTYQWGDIPSGDWDVTQQYAIDAGQIPGKVDLAKIWYPSLLKGANDFDRKAVLAQADAYKP